MPRPQVRAYLKRKASAPPEPEPEPLDHSYLADAADVNEATLREWLGKYKGETGETTQSVARSWSTFTQAGTSKDANTNAAALRLWIKGSTKPVAQAAGRKVRECVATSTPCSLPSSLAVGADLPQGGLPAVPGRRPQRQPG